MLLVTNMCKIPAQIGEGTREHPGGLTVIAQLQTFKCLHINILALCN